MIFVVDATVYDREGREYVYVQSVAGGHVVRPVVDVGDGTELDAPVYMDHVYPAAPEPRGSDRARALQAQLAALRAETHAAHEELRQAKAERDAGLKELAQLSNVAPAVGRVRDFLNNRITHLVIDLGCALAIEEVQELGQKTRERHGDGPATLPLITLFGDSKGDLQWRVNWWRDGSGTWSRCIPCTSESEALAQAAAAIDELAAEGKVSAAAARMEKMPDAPVSPATSEAVAAWARRNAEEKRTRLLAEVAARQVELEALGVPYELTKEVSDG